MNDLQIFTNEQFGNVRTVIDGETVLFCGTDIARSLEYTNPQKAVRDHCKQGAERFVQHPQSAGKTIAMTFIPEGDVYRLIVRSNMPEAERFEKWLFEDVLPTIRKHGGYLTPDKIEEALLNPDTLIRLATDLKAERAARMELEAKNAALMPKGDYYDNLVKRDHLTSLRETAKELSISERYFVESLIENEYLYRNKRGTLLPMNGKNRGYFEVKDYCNTVSGHTGVQTLVTVTGKQFLIRFFNGGAA